MHLKSVGRAPLDEGGQAPWDEKLLKGGGPP